ncbi:MULTISPECIES: response regulator transcription factor [Streptomyces]|uniref:DNA-binding response regulator, NarL/FixJ family, contains REC and HTH domains n=1 Tax=Streptomyces wuyuanensis TaxID=1196353 RepID=A0A1H0DJB7_9ACTN|nr:response regulator transcription factor [Streptomyces wuyuanensis]SDN70148.1 DNA-binding response regulator, NarL/FixJ family, contains REC and HTH domains [Streptomyces wuyuanensis]
MNAEGAVQRVETVSRISVVIADDHPVVRAGMRALLSQDEAFEIVAESSTVPDTLRAVAQHQPSVLVLDLTMADRTSLPSIPDLLAASPGTRILILTMQEDPAFARAALRIGAAGYLLKEAATEELVGAARQVANGATYLQPAMGARLAIADAAAPGADADATLTARELQILSLLALGHTNQEIARRLHVSIRTVESHRARIRDKLGTETRAELTAAARERGLLG